MASSRKSAPDPSARVSACLARHTRPGDRIGVGYSGGLDSTVLLHLLAALTRAGAGVELRALHVHHGLSPQADAWADHCRAVCAGLDIPIEVLPVRVRPQGEGPEAAARAARYAAYRAAACEAVMLAHHQDDQNETVLLQLTRGATLRGLAAMPEARVLHPGKRLLRPLLDVPRRQLAAYAHAHRLRWVEDESNADTRLARNHLRHLVRPRLEQALPGLAQALPRLARQCGEAAGLLDDLARLDAERTRAGDGYCLARLASLPPARARNLLRWALEQAGGRVRQAPLEEAVRQLAQAAAPGGAAARVRVQFGAVAVLAWQARVWIVPTSVSSPTGC